MPDSEVVLQLIRDRFDAVDKRLNGLEQTLDQVHSEVRHTNGRVTDLEQDKQEIVEMHRKRIDSMRFRSNAVTLVLASVLGGSVGYVGHAAGIW